MEKLFIVIVRCMGVLCQSVVTYSAENEGQNRDTESLNNPLSGLDCLDCIPRLDF